MAKWRCEECDHNCTLTDEMEHESWPDKCPWYEFGKPDWQKVEQE